MKTYNKILLILILFVSMLSYGISSESSTSVIKPYNLPSKFLDKNNKAYLIFNHYNNFTDKLPSNLRYIPEYHIVASGQFTKSQFKEAIKNVRPIIDVDLRGEYHGFNNDLAVSFKTLPYDDINLKKFQSEIISTENYIFNIALKKDNKLAIYRDNLKTKPNLSNPIEYVMSNPNTESEVMQSLDIPYYRITQTDHLSPTVENINRLVFLYDTVLKNTPKQWVYLHCAGGKGRTTTVTAMLVMLKQQDKHQLQPFSELISAVKSMSNQYSLMPFCKRSDKAYLCQAQWQRYETLAKFYQFVKTRLPNETYSQWLIRNSLNK